MLEEIRDEYLLPDWFLTCNIKTAAELDGFRLPCRIIFFNPGRTEKETDKPDKNDATKILYGESAEDVSERTVNNDKDGSFKSASCKASEHANDTPTEHDKETRRDEFNRNSKFHNRDDTIEYQVSYDDFAELRDVTAAALVRDQDRQLPSLHPSVLLRTSADVDIQFIDGILLHLAKELQATLLSIDLEDFEDLGWEFDRQEKQIIARSELAESKRQEKPNRNSLTGMAMHYFGARSNRWATSESWSRTMKAIAAILDAPGIKSGQRTTSENNSKSAPVISSGPTVAESPLLLYVRDSTGVLELKTGHRFLARLRDSVQERRKSGHSVVLLASLVTTSASSAECVHFDYCRRSICRKDCGQPALSRKISAGKASTVDVSPSNLKDQESSNKNKYKGEVNFRRLKRFL